jgi:hypothetical protein
MISMRQMNMWNSRPIITGTKNITGGNVGSFSSALPQERSSFGT